MSKLSFSLFMLLALGCAQQMPANEPADYDTYRADETESERQELIREAEADLAEVEREIAVVDHQLQSSWVSEEQRAEWSHDLYELKEERRQLESELARARSATPAEWRQMRGDFGIAVDSLVAAGRKLSDEVSHATATKRDEPGVRRDSGLCPVAVAGADADVEIDGGKVMVTITGDSDAAVDQIRWNARQFAGKTSYQPATSTKTDATATAPIPVMIANAEVEDGVVLTLTPREVPHVKTLQQVVERDADFLEEGACAASEMRTSKR